MAKQKKSKQVKTEPEIVHQFGMFDETLTAEECQKRNGKDWIINSENPEYTQNGERLGRCVNPE